jgi:hypothetical protein
MKFKIIILLLILYILVNKIEGYDNQKNDLLIFVSLNDEVKKDNIKKKEIRLTSDKSIYLYNYLFNVNNISEVDISLKEYMNKVKFVKDNELDSRIIKKINNYYNLNLNLEISINNYINIIKRNKFNELSYYFDNNNLVYKIMLNSILNENHNSKFDVYLINKLLDLNLIKYDISKINKLLEVINSKLIKYLKDKFNIEFSNVVILNLNNVRNLVFIGEINIF